MRLIILVVGITLLVSGGLIFGLPYLSQGRGGKIEISSLEYDLGTISMAAGKVEKTFEVKNTGRGDLKITEIRTSCDCTTASLKVGDKESPVFGMHQNPIFWSEKIAPEEIGYLEVTFDPAFHGPQGIGQVIRAVYLSTNDPQNKKVELRLITNVIE